MGNVMNFIKQLQQDKVNLTKQLLDVQNGLQELLCYVDSDKFNNSARDHLQRYVNTSDIILRVNEIKRLIEV